MEGAGSGKIGRIISRVEIVRVGSYIYNWDLAVTIHEFCSENWYFPKFSSLPIGSTESSKQSLRTLAGIRDKVNLLEWSTSSTFFCAGFMCNSYAYMIGKAVSVPVDSQGHFVGEPKPRASKRNFIQFNLSYTHPPSPFLVSIPGAELLTAESGMVGSRIFDTLRPL